MNEPSSRETEYVVVRDGKPKKTSRYYYDDDELIDYDTDTPVTTTRRIIRKKPVKEQRIKYISGEEPEVEETPTNPPETTERSIKVRRTTNGDKVLLDEDDNIIKVIRSNRTPTPPAIVEPRRIRVRRHHEPRIQYYETPDGQIIARSPRKTVIARQKEEVVYSDDEPTKVIRKLVIDPSVKDSHTVYDKEVIKKPHKKYVIRHRPAELPIDSDDEYDVPPHRSSQYVQVVHRRAAAPMASVVVKKEPSTKYVMIRKKAESEPVYAVTSSVPVVKGGRRIVYEAPAKDATTKYVYSTDAKFYK